MWWKLFKKKNVNKELLKNEEVVSPISESEKEEDDDKSGREIIDEFKSKIMEYRNYNKNPDEGNIMTIGENRGGDEDSKLVEGGYDDGGYFVE